MELEVNQDEDVQKKPKNDPIRRRHCETIRNGNNMISVHEWMQPTQVRTQKPNSEWGITFVMELEVNQDLKPSVNQDLKPSKKCPERANLPSSL